MGRVVDFTQVVATVSLTHHRKSDFDRFEAAVMGKDENTQCIATGGGMDYVMHVFTSSLASFQDLIDTLLDAEIGIDREMTCIVTRRSKSQPPDVTKLTKRGAH